MGTMLYARMYPVWKLVIVLKVRNGVLIYPSKSKTCLKGMAERPGGFNDVSDSFLFQFISHAQPYISIICLTVVMF